MKDIRERAPPRQGKEQKAVAYGVTKETSAVSDCCNPSQTLLGPCHSLPSIFVPQYLLREPHPVGYLCPSTPFLMTIRLSGLGLKSVVLVVNQRNNREEQSWGSFQGGTLVLSVVGPKRNPKFPGHSRLAFWADQGQGPLTKMVCVSGTHVKGVVWGKAHS